jgi:cytoskeletal protein CcmA (bactofilin family)
VTLSANLHIDGEVKGIIRSEADVAIGQHGSFHGDISAQHVVVNGELIGTVDCARLEIVASGQVFGDVVLEQMVIEAGGLFEGQSRRKSKESVAVISHDGHKQPVLPAAETKPDDRVDKSDSDATT